MTTIAFPTLTRGAPKLLEFGLRSYTQTMESPLTGSVQTAEIAFAARWFMSFNFADLAETDDAPAMQAWKVKLRGRANRASLYNLARPTPNGSINLTGVTLSASAAQGATSVNLAGCGAAKTLAIGDFFAVAGELKMITALATANGSGAITGASFEPPVRAAAGWSNGASVTLDKPTALFIQTSDEARWSTRPYRRTDFDIDMVEVFS